MTNKKERGNAAENIVAEELDRRLCHILARNWTMRGGEIDIIAIDKGKLLCIEVKSVDHIDDLMDYITVQKMKHLQKSLQYRILSNNWQEEYQIDVVFVQGTTIVQRFENVTQE